MHCIIQHLKYNTEKEWHTYNIKNYTCLYMELKWMS